jgi:hypothetical protein
MNTIRFLTFNFLNSKLPFVSFGFCSFLVVFEQISFYFHFDHSDVRIKQNVSFQYPNELKIRSKKQIGFVHVNITSAESRLHSAESKFASLYIPIYPRNGNEIDKYFRVIIRGLGAVD